MTSHMHAKAQAHICSGARPYFFARKNFQELIKRSQQNETSLDSFGRRWKQQQFAKVAAFGTVTRASRLQGTRMQGDAVGWCASHLIYLT